MTSGAAEQPLKMAMRFRILVEGSTSAVDAIVVSERFQLFNEHSCSSLAAVKMCMRQEGAELFQQASIPVKLYQSGQGALIHHVLPGSATCMQKEKRMRGA
mmetsp:Transcript_54403/g.99609  ORF Transcript_54403/g.99609 Transcript_54403/m.99609 type:complete len:101 (+) Transcript_54403:780-1082(+)